MRWRRLLFLIALLSPAPASAVTRFWLLTTPPDIQPTVDGGWEAGTGKKRLMYTSRPVGSAWGAGGQVTYWIFNDTVTAGANDQIVYQFVSPPMAAGNTFTSGVTTVNSKVGWRESAADDNIDRCIIGLRVISNDGSTVRATLLAVANYANTSEFGAGSTPISGSQEDCADGDTVTATYTTETGDRLVYEIGVSISGASTTPAVNLKVGGVATGTDCASADGTAIGSTASCSGWIETSNTITFDTANIDTQYKGFTKLPTTMTWFFGNKDYAQSGLTPGFDGGWTKTSAATRHRLDRHLNGSTNNTFPSLVNMDAGTTNKWLFYQMISGPLAAGTVFNGKHFWMTIMATEGNAADDVQACWISVRVLDDDGSTINGTLLSHTVGTLGAGATQEFNVSTTRFSSYVCADNKPLSDYTTAAGDRLVIEVGAATAASSATPQAYMNIGDGGGWDTDGTGSGQEDVCSMDIGHNSCIATMIFDLPIPELDTDGGPTRLYFAETAYTDNTPSAAAGWEETDELQRRTLALTKGSTAITQGQVVDTNGGINRDEIDRQYITVPLKAGAVFTAASTRVKGQIAIKQETASEEIRWVTVAARILSNDGSTVRAELLPANGYHWHVNNAGFEMNGSATVYRNQQLVGADTTVQASYTTVSGDRLAVEIGAFSDNGTTPQWRVLYGENSTDCPEFEIDFGATYNPTAGSPTHCNGWIEFSNLIEMQPTGRNPLVIQ